MRSATSAVVLLFACSAAPPRGALGPIERLPTAEEVATWTVSAQRARELAVAVMETEPERFLMIDVHAVVRNGTPI